MKSQVPQIHITILNMREKHHTKKKSMPKINDTITHVVISAGLQIYWIISTKLCISHMNSKAEKCIKPSQKHGTKPRREFCRDQNWMGFKAFNQRPRREAKAIERRKQRIFGLKKYIIIFVSNRNSKKIR